MNERMIELYREASEFAYKICREEGREGGTGDHIWNTLSTGRFAELIVQECAKSANDWYQNHDKIHSDPMSYVLAHFGVEE